MIRIKRVYELHQPSDGVRLLVDRLWPRGIKKEKIKIEKWIKEVAPSNELRKWFKHNPSRWEGFKQKYFKELDKKEKIWRTILESAKRGDITFLYASRDKEHNNAVALKEFIELKTKNEG